MLLNVLQSTGQAPTAKDYLAPNVYSVRIEKLCFFSTSAARLKQA